MSRRVRDEKLELDSGIDTNKKNFLESLSFSFSSRNK